MTGSRNLQCICCKILRVLECNRRIQHAQSLRFYAAVVSVNNCRAFNTSSHLLTEKEVSGSGASSSDGSSSESSGSESDSDAEKKTTKPATSDLISSLKKIEPDTERLASTLKHFGVSKKSIKSPEDKRKMENIYSLVKAAEKKYMYVTHDDNGNGDKSTEDLAEKLKGMEDSIDHDLVSEAKHLSKEMLGAQQETESRLLGQLLSQFEATSRQRKGKELKIKPKIVQERTMSDIMEGMLIEKKEDKDKLFDELVQRKAKKPRFRSGGTGLFKGQPIGIFTKEDLKSSKTGPKSLFEIVEEEKKSQLEFYPPRNAFEEQIQWTKEGKLWTFPIDNEAGWDDEKKVEFHEHVFLENKLTDFPKKGPVRKFMELVTTALSKNPYLTVQQKHEHIDWYRNYFIEKKEILEERLGQEGVIGTEDSRV